MATVMAEVPGGVDAIMDRAEIDGGCALGAEGFGVQDFECVGILRGALVGVEEEEQPSEGEVRL